MQSGRFGQESACIPHEEGTLEEQLQMAIKNINGKIPEIEFTEQATAQDNVLPADPSVKNFSYTLVDNEVYYRENSRMIKPEMNQTALERIKGMVKIRNSVNDLIRYQLDDFPEDVIKR